MVRLQEDFESARLTGEDLDGMVFWSDGRRFWIVTSAKEADRLHVYDAKNGSLLRKFGSSGEDLGEFRRPHDLVIVDDLLLVSERDNARIQVLRLPDLKPLGFVGVGELIVPYGIGAFREADGAYQILSGDNYDSQASATLDLTQRLKQFRVWLDGDTVRQELVRSFGDPRGDGALFRVETLTVDAGRRYVLVAEGASGNIKVYTLDGKFVTAFDGRRGREFKPEAITLLHCPDRGYLITSEDELSVSVFEIFDRDSYELLGAFIGSTTSNSDGLTATLDALPGFPGGAIFATNDDQSVVAFDWLDVARAMSLPSHCTAAGDVPAG